VRSSEMSVQTQTGCFISARNNAIGRARDERVIADGRDGDLHGSKVGDMDSGALPGKSA
jgi:hypothetical protein